MAVSGLVADAAWVQFIPDEQGTFMEWSFEGVTCHGVFKPEASVAIFNFCLQESMVTITYRILDPNSRSLCLGSVMAGQCGSVDSRVAGSSAVCCVAFATVAMAVCIVDVDSEHTPTIQYGNMYVLPILSLTCRSLTCKRLLACCRYRVDPNKYDRELEE